MINKKYLVLLFLLSLTISASEYTISGNTRTKKDYIEHLIKECNEKEAEDLGQCLMNKKIFSSVKVNGTNIEIEERWTLIPIPQINVSSTSSSYGVFVIERNFLGRGKFAILGASLGSNTDSFFFLYRDPELLLTDWTSQILLLKSQEDLMSYSGEQVDYSYTEEQTGLKLGVGHKIFNDFELGLTGTFMKKKFKALGGYAFPTENESIGAELGFKYKNSDYKFYFNEGFDGELTFITDFHRSDSLSNVNLGLMTLRYQRNVYMQHALQFSLKSNISNQVTIKDVSKFGGSKGFRGIQENGLWAESMASLAIDYQVPVVFSNFGVWTIAPFFDYGVIQSDFSTASNYSSYGIGGYLYLKQVAIPGVGIVVGRNEKFQGNFISFSVGLRP